VGGCVTCTSIIQENINVEPIKLGKPMLVGGKHC
jgi:hypothetical protein